MEHNPDDAEQNQYRACGFKFRAPMKLMNGQQRAIPLYLLLAILFFVWNSGVALSDPPPPPPSASPDVKTGIVTGRFVVQGGGSMAGGKVMLYNSKAGPPPNIALYKRVPSLIVEIDSEEGFQGTLPVGKYYLVAIKRNSGKHFGRPQQGDYSFRYSKPGSRELNQFSIKEGDRFDFGTLEAHPWQESRMDAMSVSTAIEGTLTDMEGKPVENVLVFAFTTPRMQGRRPKFISEKTEKDGKYSLMIAGDATYFLMARDTMGGGQLREGETIGVYGTPTPVGVAIKTGEIVKGINFKVTKMKHRGPVETESSEQEPDPTEQGSQNPSLRPLTLPGTQLEKSSPEKAGSK
ncbi:MAG: hypothetical protein ACYDBT_05910 [Desulfobulbaceae bacterium]